MKQMTTWLLIAATILIGLAGLTANAEETFTVKVSTRLPQFKFLGVTSDERIIGIVCEVNLVKSALSRQIVYSADLVFPAKDGELDLDSYRTEPNARSRRGDKPAYRPMSAEHATDFCSKPYDELAFKVDDDGAELLLPRKGNFSAKSFNIRRRSF